MHSLIPRTQRLKSRIKLAVPAVRYVLHHQWRNLIRANPNALNLLVLGSVDFRDRNAHPSGGQGQGNGFSEGALRLLADQRCPMSVMECEAENFAIRGRIAVRQNNKRSLRHERSPRRNKLKRAVVT